MTLEKLAGVPNEKRAARLRMVIAAAFPNGRVEIATGSIEGLIAQEPIERREPGYPFRSLFMLPELGKYYLDLTQEEHERHNHRRQALQKLDVIHVSLLLRKAKMQKFCLPLWEEKKLLACSFKSLPLHAPHNGITSGGW